ncbi:MAG: ATP phosphoribosyltransferase regulatory subunit, partial [Rectinemataceae bacterium]|nr:ATP phosphoribosyltransferase regulatory subunit [Rectinemataceae bacterium]
KLQRVVELVRKADSNFMITLDPLEYRGFEYHTGVCFSIFSKSAGGELGRGGRYIIENTRGLKFEATGMTLSVSALQRLVPVKRPKAKVYCVSETLYSALKQLREQGYRTVMAVKAAADERAEAKALGCRYIYKNDKLEKI